MAFYNHRGTAERYIKEGKKRYQMDPTVRPQVPQQRGAPSASRPGLQSGQLHADAGVAEGCAAAAGGREHWSLTTLREKLVKIGAKVISHGRYVTFQLAEVAMRRALFRKILRR